MPVVGLDNDLVPVRRQSINLTKDGPVLPERHNAHQPRGGDKYM